MHQISVLLTSVPVKVANFTSAYPSPADWLLGKPEIERLSRETLTSLSCYLIDFSVLVKFPNLEKLQIVSSEELENDGGPDFNWEVSLEQAQCLAQLPKLRDLCFFGFTAVDLSPASMPQLKVSRLSIVNNSYIIYNLHFHTFSDLFLVSSRS